MSQLEDAERAALPVLNSPRPSSFDGYTSLLMGWWSLQHHGLLSKTDSGILEKLAERTRNKLEKIERRLIIREHAQANGQVRLSHLSDAELLRFRDPK
jgi:hypothetical protein